MTRRLHCSLTTRHACLADVAHFAGVDRHLVIREARAGHLKRERVGSYPTAPWGVTRQAYEEWAQSRLPLLLEQGNGDRS